MIVCSVIVPAHNEANVLGNLLSDLQVLDRSSFEVIVVCNGCSDSTIRVSERFDVKTIEISHPSKADALNRGLQVAVGISVVVIDADIRVDASAIVALSQVLNTSSPVAASLSVEFLLEGRSVLVRSYYNIFKSLPYVSDGLVGLGLYGLSGAGLRRLGAFPNIIADDLYVQRLFDRDERVVVAGHRFVVSVPRTVRSLILVRARVSRGNRQLRVSGSASPLRNRGVIHSSHFALFRLMLRGPKQFFDGVVYAAITFAARIISRRRTSTRWERDSTTR